MRTIVIIGGIVLAGATTIAIMMDDRQKPVAPVIQNQGIINTSAPLGETPKVNPAHGLPGHRCDLPVGAALTNASGTPVPASTPQTINVNPGPQQQAAPAPAGLKVNPAHGLPGHRCDLQVGAPLN